MRGRGIGRFDLRRSRGGIECVFGKGIGDFLGGRAD